MAKLYFRYGVMGCGKTSQLLQVAYNYEKKGEKILVIKPKIDKKGDNTIITRMGNISKEVNYLLEKNELISNLNLDGIKAIIVDEAQFLTPEQVYDLWDITKDKNIPVIAYGLRSDFRTDLFPGTSRLMALADEMEELPTICSSVGCNVKARFNARKVNGDFTISGEQVEIDGIKDEVEYMALCPNCYRKKVLKKTLMR